MKRKRAGFFYGLLAAVCHLACLTAAEPSKIYTIGPEPDWAEPLPLPDAEKVPLDQVSGGLYILLCDEQLRVTPRESYGQYARKLLNDTGVQQGSEIQLEVNPAYESIELHKVEILRDGQWQQRLNPSIVSVIQRETDMERFLLDGRYTIVIRPTDVRAGDVLRYSFTKRGANPVMNGHFFTAFSVERGYPCARLRERIWAPPGMELQIKNHHTDLAVTKERTTDGTRYEWSAHNLPPLLDEPNVPAWFGGYPWVQVEDMSSWKEVVEWALPLYDFNQPLPPDLEKEIESLKSLTAEEKVRRVLLLTQEQVRYFGAETGENSHKPRPPATIYAQRFGDCKEKALLFCTILRRLDIKADPVLVSFGWSKGVKSLLPSPSVFDHVIVRVKVDGEFLFLDPTSSYQRGPLRQMSLFDFGFGLVVEEGVSSLTEVRPRPESLGGSVVEETLELPPLKGEGSGTLKIHTVFSGLSAERERRRHAASSRTELQEGFRRFYEQTFSSIEVLQPLRMTDHEERNIVETWEEYRVPKIWKPLDKKNGVKTWVYPREIAMGLDNPGMTNRRFPLQLIYPANIRITTKVKFPEDWTVEPEKHEENNDYFEFAQQISGTGKDATVTTRFRTLQDHVPVNGIEIYQAHRERAAKDLGYEFSHTIPAETVATKAAVLAGTASVWPLYVVTLLSLFASAAGAVIFWLVGRNKPRRMCPYELKHFDGLGGWLILVGFGIVFRPFALAVTVVRDFLAPFTHNEGLWGHFTQPGGTFYSPVWMPLFLFESALYTVLFVGSTLMLVLFFQKRRELPILFISIMGITLAITVIDLVAMSLIATEAIPPEMRGEEFKSPVVRSFIAAAIWIPYMLVSRRVKATFRR